jgi:hypothetical protein
VAGLVTHLSAGQSLDPATVFAGPWHSIQTAVLRAGQAFQLDSEQLESAVFVEHGDVTLTLSHSTVPMTAGDAVTLVMGASGSFTAGRTGARLFITRLKARV